MRVGLADKARIIDIDPIAGSKSTAHITADIKSSPTLDDHWPRRLDRQVGGSRHRTHERRTEQSACQQQSVHGDPQQQSVCGGLQKEATATTDPNLDRFPKL